TAGRSMHFPHFKIWLLLRLFAHLTLLSESTFSASGGSLSPGSYTCVKTHCCSLLWNLKRHHELNIHKLGQPGTQIFP
ncbi:hypothetical protein B0H13DRAFT_2042219, partial [Mycena leptocephala]